MRRPIKSALPLLASPFALALSLASREAAAVTVTVDANGNCTMTEAVKTLHDLVDDPDPVPRPGCSLSALSEPGLKVFVVAANTHQIPAAIPVNVTMTIEGASRSMTTVRSTGRAFTVQGFFSRNPTLTIRNITLQGNTTPRSGTGVVVDTGLGQGAGPAHLFLSNVRITNYVGGVGAFSQTNQTGGLNVDAVVNDSVIESNDQTGIRSDNSRISLSNTTLRGNNDGGIRAILRDPDVAVVVSNSLIENNFSGNPGGGIMVSYEGFDQPPQPDLTVSGSTIRGNRSNGDGGGIYLLGRALITRSTLASNTGTNGGGIHVAFPLELATELTARETVFSGNAAANGGGFYLDGQNSTSVHGFIEQCLLTNNVASSNGGGYFSTGQEAIDNTTINANRARLGGGVFHDGQEFHMRYGTVSANTATDRGGGVVIANVSNPLIRSSIFANNTATNGHNDFFFSLGIPDPTNKPRFNLIESVSQTGAFVEGGEFNNIVGDPALDVLQNLGGFTSVLPLKPGSRAIDTGESGIGIDQRGVTRPLDGNDATPNAPRSGFDMGAFEAPENIAVPFGSASASSSSNGRGPNLARDRLANTSWQSAVNGSGTLTISFTSGRTISSITLREFNNRISAYRIETRAPGGNFTTLLTDTTVGNAKLHPFTPRNVNAVRIVVTNATGQPSIREFEIY